MDVRGGQQTTDQQSWITFTEDDVDSRNLASPWYPTHSLPQTPCGIEIDAAPGQVAVRVVYSFYGGEHDLVIELKTPVFGVFEEANSPVVGFPPDYPNVSGRYLWPLMKVHN